MYSLSRHSLLRSADFQQQKMTQPVHAQVRILSRHTGHAEPEVEKDIVRTRYFDPYEAVDYGIIDRVSPLYPCIASTTMRLHVHTPKSWRLGGDTLCMYKRKQGPEWVAWVLACLGSMQGM